MKEVALSYEHLIRAAFKCDKNQIYSANVDLYLKLAETSAKQPVDQYKLGVKVGGIAVYITSALYKVKEDYKDNKDFVSKIEGCLSLLEEPSLENIDTCIEKSWEAFEGIGLSV